MGIGRPLVAITGMVLVLGGCAKAVSGTAQPNAAELGKINAVAYERGIKAVRDHFKTLKDEKGKLYNYLRFGSKNREREFETASLGTPPAILYKQQDGEAGDEFDEFHPAGSDVDYVRLGDKHTHLAPTRWVSVPTSYPKDLPVSVCQTIIGFGPCHLDKALAQTKQEAPDRQPRQVRTTGDGTEISTGITLGAAIEEDLITPPEDIAKDLTPEMKGTILPVLIMLGRDDEFRKFEIRTTVSGGPATLEVQLGYEVTGKSGRKDFPAVPAASEVTALTDKAAVEKFWDDLINDR